MKLGLPVDLLNVYYIYEAESALKLKVESTFDLLPNPVLCVVCSFMASLSNARPQQEKVLGFYL